MTPLIRAENLGKTFGASGAGLGHVLFRQMLPNIWAPILVAFSLDGVGAVGLVAAAWPAWRATAMRSAGIRLPMPAAFWRCVTA